MAVSGISDLDITEDWAAFEVLTEEDLHTAMVDMETAYNTGFKLNIYQFAADVFENYTFNNDGNATLGTPLETLCAKLADNETVTGSWTFQGSVSFEEPVTSDNTFTSSGQMRCHANKVTTNQSITDATITGITLNNEVYDKGSMHDNSTNSERITIPTGGAGIYAFFGQVTFAANATGRRELYLYKNGSKVAEAKEFNPDGTETTVLQVNYQDEASVNDYYELRVYQNSTAALNVIAGATSTFFTALKAW